MPYILKKSVKNKEHVYVKSFSGASNKDMEFHIRPTLLCKSDLRTDETSVEIADSILKLLMLY